jgi:hypothetical protein
LTPSTSSGWPAARPTRSAATNENAHDRSHTPTGRWVKGTFGEHFTGAVNPGAHQGTVGEEEFLEGVIGVPAPELSGFCAQFDQAHCCQPQLQAVGLPRRHGAKTVARPDSRVPGRA